MFLRIREREREIQIDGKRVGGDSRTETERDRKRQKDKRIHFSAWMVLEKTLSGLSPQKTNMYVMTNCAYD